MNQTRRLGSLLIVAALLAGACGSNGTQTHTDPIVIGSFDTSEGHVIGELYRLALAEAAFPVVHRSAIGDRAVLLGSDGEATIGLEEFATWTFASRYTALQAFRSCVRRTDHAWRYLHTYDGSV